MLVRLRRVDAEEYEARPIRKLFTKGQKAFYTQHAPEGVELDDLSVLGPMNVLKLKFTPKGFARRLVASTDRAFTAVTRRCWRCSARRPGTAACRPA